MNFQTDNYLVSDKVYKVKLHETNIETLQGLKEKTTKRIKSALETRFSVQVQALKEEIGKLNQKIEKVKNKSFVEGLKLVDNLENWKVKDGYLHYLGDIIATHVIKRDQVFELNKSKEFYIEGLRVKITPNPIRAFYTDSNHPNCNVSDAVNYVCIGDLEGKDLKTVIENLPHTLKTINLNSAFGHDHTRNLTEYLDDYVTEGGAETIWTQ